jgi:hypothetical protein
MSKGRVVIATFVISLLGIYLYAKWDVHSFPNQSHAIGRSFVITQTYGGQMTRAIRNMMVQQCWGGVHREDIVITEPFSIESTLVHEPQIWSDLEDGHLDNASRFGDYYNLSFYNAQSLKHRLAQLVKWEHFIASAPRVAVAISIPTHRCSGVEVDFHCSFVKSFEGFVDALIGKGFKVVKRMCIVCSDTHQRLNMNYFNKLLFDVGGNEVSVIMDSWRNYGFTSTWMEIPDYCVFAEKPQTSKFLIPSDLVNYHSSSYIDHFIGKKRFVGIMLRIERFLSTAFSGRSGESIQSCLTKIMSLYDNMKSDNLGVYVTLDIGKYGSGVMQKSNKLSGRASITEIVESFLTHLYDSGITLEMWEDSFTSVTDGISERGYIAMVQRNIAKQADCLILMGGGSFQQVAGFQHLMDARNRNRKPCLRTVCALKSFKKLFNT